MNEREELAKLIERAIIDKSFAEGPFEARARVTALAAADAILSRRPADDEAKWARREAEALDLLASGRADEIADLQSLLREAREALENLLEQATRVAAWRGLADCNCIALSRADEAAYETGMCPHQRASAVLRKMGGQP